MKKRFTLFISGFTLLSLALACLFALHGFSSGGAAKAAGPQSGCGWQTVASRNPSSQVNYLSTVAAISPNDVWATGYSFTKASMARTLTEHWNGTAWSVVASPNAMQNQVPSYLYSVASITTNDVWAVGQYSDPQGHNLTLTEHWNGLLWKIVPGANASSTNNGIYSVIAIATNDVWAVGNSDPPTSSTSVTPHSGGAPVVPLIEHWNGQQWQVVPSPAGTQGDTLQGVSGSASGDVWAVGYNENSGQTLTEHWNGSAWSVVSSPNGSSFTTLTAVSSLSATNVWAVGSAVDASGLSHPFTMHWNGSAWKVVPTPNVSGAKITSKVIPFSGGFSNALTSVAAIHGNDVWATGSFFNSSTQVVQTLTMHWDGKVWTVVPSPNPGSNYNDLSAIASVPQTGTVWAVGAQSSSSVTKTLVERYC